MLSVLNNLGVLILSTSANEAVPIAFKRLGLECYTYNIQDTSYYEDTVYVGRRISLHPL